MVYGNGLKSRNTSFTIPNDLVFRINFNVTQFCLRFGVFTESEIMCD